MSGKAVHGDASVGNRTRLYDIWRGIRQRCNNPKANGYSDYGGRGIRVIPAWDDYIIFKEWALSSGYADNLSIERRNVDGDYKPKNCYWACNTVQACNKRKRLGKTSEFIGVAPNKGNWQAYVNYKGIRTNLGTYPTPKEAAIARDTFVKEKGYPHKLNF